jgi:RNA polymerase sigma-70 factor, ECF subfamily
VNQEGREERFRDLYDSMRSRLTSYALRRTLSPEDAADVIAEVFTIAWRRIDDIPRDDAGILWLYATARRVIANRGRKVMHQQQVIERLRHLAGMSLVPMAHPGHERSMIGVLVLSRMDEDDREILMLAGWEGLGTAELACTLQCSPTAARIRLHRARARLSAALISAGVDSGPPVGRRDSEPLADSANQVTEEAREK